MRVRYSLFTLLLVLAVAGCTATSNMDDAPTPVASDDQAQIYAATIRQIYTVDHSFGEAPGWPLVYVVSTTDDSVMGDAPSAASQNLSPELQDAITAELAEEPFQLIWIDEREGAPIDPTNGQVANGKGIVISLGNIHPQDDGSVQLSFFMTCGGLCGIGKTYVLSQVDGAWQVTGSVGPEIIS